MRVHGTRLCSAACAAHCQTNPYAIVSWFARSVRYLSTAPYVHKFLWHIPEKHACAVHSTNAALHHNKVQRDRVEVELQ
jgi:hypothetical protein